MNETITLRPATMVDADILLEWRNDPETRKASHNTVEVQMSDHVSWLSRTLGNPDRRLYIAEENGEPVGTVRADFADGVWELSWTVSPESKRTGSGETDGCCTSKRSPRTDTSRSKNWKYLVSPNC